MFKEYFKLPLIFALMAILPYFLLRMEYLKPPVATEHLVKVLFTNIGNSRYGTVYDVVVEDDSGKPRTFRFDAAGYYIAKNNEKIIVSYVDEGTLKKSNITLSGILMVIGCFSAVLFVVFSICNIIKYLEFRN